MIINNNIYTALYSIIIKQYMVILSMYQNPCLPNVFVLLKICLKIMCSLLAGDGMNIPDILSINAGQWYILA